MSMGNCVSVKPKIRVIPAKTRQELVSTSVGKRQEKLRVAAYARVSTEHEEQESSYEAQVKHFTKLIAERQDWEMVKIYADPGLSGKNIKRPEFLKLMKACEDGLVDKIITKSVSRFARNTIDCVESVRKLRNMGIGVYFEKENLDTLHENSEFVLTIMASLAEEESRSMSNNIRWSVRKKFEQGKVILNTARFLGYKREKNSDILEIVPEEAITVRRIYREFLAGASLKDIADALERDSIPSPSGQSKWHVSTIRSILTNEKYQGDCHLQKTYLPDFLSPRRVENVGQADSWYVEDSHAAIITREQFALVQEEFKRRKSLRASTETGNGKFSGKYAFSGMIVCGECGETYRRHQQYNQYKVYPTWACKVHENTGAKHCTAKPIKEKALEDAVVRAINKLMENKEQFLAELKATVLEVMLDDSNDYIVRIDTEIAELQNDITVAIERMQKAEITAEEYKTLVDGYKRKIDVLNLDKEEIIFENGKLQLLEYRIAEVEDLLGNGRILEEFDKNVFKGLVQRIIVLSQKEIQIDFKCGITVKERL